MGNLQTDFVKKQSVIFFRILNALLINIFVIFYN